MMEEAFLLKAAMNSTTMFEDDTTMDRISDVVVSLVEDPADKCDPVLTFKTIGPGFNNPIVVLNIRWSEMKKITEKLETWELRHDGDCGGY